MQAEYSLHRIIFSMPFIGFYIDSPSEAYKIWSSAWQIKFSVSSQVRVF